MRGWRGCAGTLSFSPCHESTRSKAGARQTAPSVTWDGGWGAQPAFWGAAFPETSIRWKVPAACTTVARERGKGSRREAVRELGPCIPTVISQHQDNCQLVTAEVRHDRYLGKSSRLRDLPAATQFSTGTEREFSQSPLAQALSGWIQVQATVLPSSLPSKGTDPHQRAAHVGCDPWGGIGSSRVPSLKAWSSYGV